MSTEKPEPTAQSLEQGELRELRRILQSDDIAPVDDIAYSKRLAQIILNAIKGRLPWSQD